MTYGIMPRAATGMPAGEDCSRVKEIYVASTAVFWAGVLLVGWPIVRSILSRIGHS